MPSSLMQFAWFGKLLGGVIEFASGALLLSPFSAHVPLQADGPGIWKLAVHPVACTFGCVGSL